MPLIPEQDREPSDDGDDAEAFGRLASPTAANPAGVGTLVDGELRLLSDDPESMQHYQAATFGIPDDDPYYDSSRVRVLVRRNTNGHGGVDSPVQSSMKGSVSGKHSPSADVMSDSNMSDSRKRVLFRVHDGDDPLSPGGTDNDATPGGTDSTAIDLPGALIPPPAGATA